MAFVLVNPPIEFRLLLFREQERFPGPCRTRGVDAVPKLFGYVESFRRTELHQFVQQDRLVHLVTLSPRAPGSRSMITLLCPRAPERCGIGAARGIPQRNAAARI